VFTQLIRKPFMSRHAELAAALAICIVGIALRMVQITYNFDGDELFSARLAAQPFGEVIRQSLADSPHPPLHYLLLSLWVRAFGAGEISVRAFSIFCSAAFLVVAHRLLRRLMPPGPALGTLGILAVSPFFVYYGQQARAYSLIALLSAVNLLAYWRLLDTPGDRRRAVVWATSCAMLAWAQYLAVLAVAVEIAVLLPGLPRRDRAAVLCCGTLAIASVLPWLMAAMGGQVLRRTDPLPHIGWLERPEPRDLAWFYIGVFGELPGLQARWLLLTLAALGAAYYSTRIRCGLSRSALMLTVMGLGVPLAVLVLSIYGPKPIFVGRQLIGSALAFVGLVGLWAASQPRWLGGTILVGTVVWSAAAVPAAFPVHSRPPWRAVADYLDANYPGRLVLATEDWVARPLSYYRRAGEVRLEGGPLSEPALLLCRPGRDEGLARSLAPLRGWEWSRARNDPDGLTLYEASGESH
jgi:mannosyltransferase